MGMFVSGSTTSTGSFGALTIGGNVLRAGIDRADAVSIGTTSPVSSLALTVAGTIGVANTSGGGIVSETSTTSNPTLVPNYSYNSTGIGGSPANDILSLIVAGDELMRLDEENRFIEFKDVDNISGSSISTGSFGHVYAEKDIFMGGMGNIGGTANATTHSIIIGTDNRAWGMTARKDPDVLSIGEMGYATMAMNFGTGQKVGIGVADPDSRLEIKGAGTTSQAFFRIRTSADVQQVEIANDGSGVPHLGIGNVAGSTKISLSSAGSSFSAGDVTVTEDVIVGGNVSGSSTSTGSFGMVGIGTASPQGTLHIDSALGEQSARLTYNHGQGNILGAVINGYKLTSGLLYRRIVDIAAIGDDTNNRGSEIRFLTAPISDGIAVPNMIIDPSGKVGIETSSPDAHFHISSSSTIGSTTASLHIEGSGSSVVAVDGTQGRLFSVTDEMSGSIFSANTIAGLPVIEAFSDNKVNLGPYSSPVHIDSSGNISGSAASTGSFGRLELSSDTSNTGSFYEEGTWTPALAGGHSATISGNKYVKVGSTVQIWATLANVVDAGGSDNVEITGLPYIGKVTFDQIIGNAQVDGVTLTAGRGSQVLFLDESRDCLQIINNVQNAAPDPLNWGDVATNDDIMIHGTYVLL